MISFVILNSCNNNQGFKEIRDLKNSEWQIANKQIFKFDIKDISKTHSFNYLLRYNVGYPYFNIYLEQTLVGPDGKPVIKTMDEIILFDQKTGKPLGDGMGDLFDLRRKAPKLQKFKLNQPGTYQWVITHNMRPDPLEGIMSVGAEVVFE